VTDEKIPDFKALDFEDLMLTDSKDGADEFNDALWTEQRKRKELFNIADREKLEDVDTYQDKIDQRLTNLEAKFEALTKLIEKTGLVDVPKRSLDQYLEDATK
jgi:acetolactate synthase small subunit